MGQIGSNSGECKITDQTLINVAKWKTMVNLLPKWISGGNGKRLNKTWAGLFFIIKNNDLPAVRNKNIKDSLVRDSA